MSTLICNYIRSYCPQPGNTLVHDQPWNHDLLPFHFSFVRWIQILSSLLSFSVIMLCWAKLVGCCDYCRRFALRRFVLWCWFSLVKTLANKLFCLSENVLTFTPQILANPKHRFNTSSIYKNVTLVAWDPAPYTVNLHKVFLFLD